MLITKFFEVFGSSTPRRLKERERDKIRLFLSFGVMCEKNQKKKETERKEARKAQNYVRRLFLVVFS